MFHLPYRVLFVAIAFTLSASTATVLAQSELPERLRTQQNQIRKLYDNVQVKIERFIDGSGSPDLVGTIYTSGEMWATEFQYVDQDPSVEVIRGDAYFLLDKRSNEWIPRRVDRVGPRFPSVAPEIVAPIALKGEAYALDTPDRSFTLTMMSENSLKWADKRDQNRTGLATFADTTGACTEMTSTLKGTGTIKWTYKYDDQARLTEAKGIGSKGDTSRTTFVWTNDQKIDSSIFYLDHYGLSETLLGSAPSRKFPPAYQVLLFIGLVLVSVPILARLLRRGK